MENLGKLEEVAKAAFVAGCKYIINNTQKEMSQYLNIYIKVKGQDKPLHLADYCRSSEVYQSICEQCVVPYDTDGETYGDLKAKDIHACMVELDKSNEALVNACQLRMEALEHNKDKDVAESILTCIDD